MTTTLPRFKDLDLAKRQRIFDQLQKKKITEVNIPIICDPRPGSKFTVEHKPKGEPSSTEDITAETDDSDNAEGKNEGDAQEDEKQASAAPNIWDTGAPKGYTGRSYSKHYKFLVRRDSDAEPVTASKLLFLLRQQLKDKIDASEALYLFLEDKNALISGQTELKSLYDKHKNEDGFLYFVFDVEATFGG